MSRRTAPEGFELVERAAGRVVVLDRDDQVLLVHGRDVHRPDDGTWWFTPGGGADPGESVTEAAARELREETGLVVPDLGPSLVTRHVAFPFEDAWLEQDEAYFVARVDARAPAVAAEHVTEWEERNLLGMRWWDRRALVAADVTLFPGWLPDLLAALLDEGRVPSDTPDEATFHDAAIRDARRRLADGRP